MKSPRSISGNPSRCFEDRVWQLRNVKSTRVSRTPRREGRQESLALRYRALRAALFQTATNTAAALIQNAPATGSDFVVSPTT